MTRPARRWAMGCGCGCGLLLLILGLLGWSGFVYVRGLIEQGEKAEEAMAEVRRRHGGLSDFQPGPDGTLSPERIETFLRVRELMAEKREQTEASLSVLSSSGTGGADQVPGLLGELVEWGLGAAKLEGARQLIPQAIGFVAARGEALLEAGMGSGEYLYIYSVAYYSWLRKSPADGPAFPLVGDDGDGGQGHRGGRDEFDVREGRREVVLRRLNERLLPMLRRQLAAVDAGPPAREGWREALAAEVSALESDPFRIPWRDGVPEPLATSLEPFRRRLESSYSALCNPLEVVPGSGE